LKKIPKGRAKKRLIYNRRYVNVDPSGRKRSPNWNAGRPEVPQGK
jgi:Ribosomal protein S30.